MNEQRIDQQKDDELREFMLVLRQALLMVCAYIEKRYGLTTPARKSTRGDLPRQSSVKERETVQR